MGCTPLSVVSDRVYNASRLFRQGEPVAAKGAISEERIWTSGRKSLIILLTEDYKLVLIDILDARFSVPPDQDVRKSSKHRGNESMIVAAVEWFKHRRFLFSSDNSCNASQGSKDILPLKIVLLCDLVDIPPAR